MAPRHDELLFINHASELGGGELSLLGYVGPKGADATVLLFRDGPLVDELRQRGVWVELVPGMAGVLTMSRSTGPIKSALEAARGFGGVLALARRLRRARLVYTNSQKATVVGAVAALIARRPMVWHLHDIMTAPDISTTARRIVITLTNYAARLVIANSQATAKAYRLVGGTRPVIVIPNGIDSHPLVNQDRAANRDIIARELGIGSAPLLGLFGRIDPMKGQDVAIKALVELPTAHLLLVGGPLFGQEAYYKELKHLALINGVIDRVHFLGFRRNIPTLMASVDIALQCSTGPEAFGRVIVEAMMAGTPVIATPMGGASDIVAQTGAGTLVSPGDVNALAQAVRTILDDPIQATADARNAQVRASQLYDLASINTQIDTVLSQVIQ